MVAEDHLATAKHHMTQNFLCFRHRITVTPTIIPYCHKRVKHNGLNETLTEVHSKYWIPKGRQTARNKLFGLIYVEDFKAGTIQFQNRPIYQNFVSGIGPLSAVKELTSLVLCL